MYIFSSIGEFLNWRSIPNRQIINNLTKITAYGSILITLHLIAKLENVQANNCPLKVDTDNVVATIAVQTVYYLLVS